MLTSRLLVVLAWALLLAPGAEAAPDATEGTAGVRRIELRADAHSAPPEVRIRPGYSTTLFFDSPIQPEQVELEGRERFQRVGITEDHLALIPASALRPGERLRLQVRFRDGALPELAAFILVVDPLQVEHQVELYRHPRTAESYRQEVAELKAGMLLLREEVERLGGARPPTGDLDCLLTLIEEPDSLRYAPLGYQQLSGPFSMRVLRAGALSLGNRWTVLRFRLQMSSEAADWTAVGVSLMDAQGQPVKTRLPWQPGPLRFNREQSIVVPLEDGATLGEGPHTLKLWDEAGRAVTFEGITTAR